MMGSVFAIPIFAQTFLGFNATQSGLLFIPMGLCIPLSAILLGRRLAKFSARSVIFWSTLGAAAAFYFLSWIDPRSTAFDLVWPLAIMALFMGAGMAQRTNLIAVAVPVTEIGVASSILALVRNLGGAFGIAVFGTIISTFTQNNALAIARNSIIHAATKAQYNTAIGLISLKAQVLAYSQVYIISALVVGAGAFAIFLIKKPGKEDAHRELTKEQEMMMEAG
jgi:DHA2 family multidrug resistance protein